MGKFSFSIVALTFLALFFFTFSGGDLFFKSLRVAPEEITGAPIPNTFEVEQSLKSQEGEILIGISRSNDLRLHIVKPQADAINPFQTTSALLEEAKLYRTTGSKDAGFLVKYLSAQVDPRRTKVEESVGDLFIVQAQKKKWFGILYLPMEQTLIIAGHPEDSISSGQVLKAIAELGYAASEDNAQPKRPSLQSE